ncbi:hypothetical protein Tco_1160338, partial [Tanacetum coccineum]
VIDDMMKQLSFEETELDGEAGFIDVAGSGIDSSGLSHDESFGVDDLDLNLNEPVRTQEPIVTEVNPQVPIVEEVGTQEFTPSNGQFFFDDEGIDTAYETEYDVQSSEDAVSDDVLEREEVDAINADGFDSDPGNDEETNYRKRRLAELRTEIEGVINASGQWKYSFYTGQKFTTPKEAKDRVYLHSIESRRNLKLYKNDSVRIRAICDGKLHVFTMSQGTGPISLNHGIEAGPSESSGLTTRSKKRKNTGTNDDSQPSLCC